MNTSPGVFQLWACFFKQSLNIEIFLTLEVVGEIRVSQAISAAESVLLQVFDDQIIAAEVEVAFVDMSVKALIAQGQHGFQFCGVFYRFQLVGCECELERDFAMELHD